MSTCNASMRVEAAPHLAAMVDVDTGRLNRGIVDRRGHPYRTTGAPPRVMVVLRNETTGELELLSARDLRRARFIPDE